MWNEGDPRRELREHEVAMGRSSGGSEVVVMDERVLDAFARAPPASININATKSPDLHIGPKFVSITQNVDNTEVIKDLPLPRYLWDITKSTTKAERLSCAAALLVLTICILLVVYFTVMVKKTDNVADVAPHEWYIDRDMWLAPEFTNDDEKTSEFEPLRLVIIAHTVSPECTRFINCAAELRNLQTWFLQSRGHDIPYNFLIGNDGRVYEARGWNVVGEHTEGYDRCSLGLAFIGDYREGLPSYSKVTALQLERAKMLLDRGVELGHLHPYYHVLGAKDLKATQSPGTNIYNVIQQWASYNHENIYRDKSCEDILSLYDNQTDVAGLTTTLAPVLRENEDGN